MKFNPLLFSLTAMLALAFGAQQPIFAAKKADKKNRSEKHHKHSKSSSSSSSDHHKKKHCCKATLEFLAQIDQTTIQDLIVDRQTLNVVNNINQTTQQDLAVDQQTLDVVNEINQTTQEDLAVDQETLDVVNNINAIVSCSAPQSITQDMLTPAGLVITQPGYYQFCEDISFTPTTAVNAITIASSNVTLDFKNHSLTQTNGSPTFFVEAVHVNRGLRNVRIVGDEYAMGQIRNFSFRAIDVEACNYVTIANMLVTNDTQVVATLDVSPGANNLPAIPGGIWFLDYDPLATYTGAKWSSTAGTTAAITAISGNGTTVTYTAANTFVAGQIVTITGATASAYNLANAVIATASATQFTVTSSATGATSAATATQSGPYMVTFTIPAQSVPPQTNTPYNLSGFSNTAAITAISGDGTTVTYTAANSFLPGQVVTITGSTTAAYNLSNAVIATASASQFTIINPATGATSTATATQTVSLNGAFLCTASSLTSMTFAYANNPGTFGPAAGTITNLNTISNRPSTNVTISNVEVSNHLAGAVISRVSNLDIDGLKCTNNALVGCWFGNVPTILSSLEPYVINTRVKNSNFNSNGQLAAGNLTGAGPFIYFVGPSFGAEINRCQNIEFTDCSFDGNFLTITPDSRTFVLVNLCKGMDDDGSTEVTIRSCSFDDNFTTAPGITVEGIHFSGSINNLLPNRNLVIEESTFDGNYIQYNSTVPSSALATVNALGFFYVKGVQVSNCTANGNYISRVTPNAADAVRGYLNSGDRTVAIPGPSGSVSNLNNEDMVFEDCVALHNFTNSGSVFGFQNIATASTTTPRTNLLLGVIYRNCIAAGNQTNDFISATASGNGFRIQPGTNSVNRIIDKIILDGCIANRNGKAGSISGQTSAGYYVSGSANQGPDRNIILQNCTASANDGYGFLFGNAETTLVKSCESDNNTVGGFVDLLDDSTSVLIKNIAVANGPNGAGPNYLGLSPTTPIALWKPSDTSSPFTFNNQMYPAFGVTGSFVGAGTTFTVTATNGIITPGMILTGGTTAYLGAQGPAPLSQGVGPKILAQLTGTLGGTGTYVVDRAQSAGATATGLAIGGLDPELDNIDIQN